MTYQAIVGQPVEVVVGLGSTGLTFGTLTTAKAADGITIVDDLEAELNATLSEIHAVQFPGIYVFMVTPVREGTLYVSLTAGVVTQTFEVQSQLRRPYTIVDPAQDGDYTVTVTVGATPIPDAFVRIYDVGGTVLVTQGITNSLGKVTFALAAGQYQVRVRKSGYDFSGTTPYTITVLPNDDVAPQAYELLPSTGSIADTIAIRGEYFHLDDSEVLFGVTSAVPLVVSQQGTVLLVEVPAGLTDTAVPVRVRKPDPNNVGQYLLSSVLTFVRV